MQQLLFLMRQLIRVVSERSAEPQQPTHNLEHYSVEEVAAILSCHPNSVRNIIKDEELKTFRYKNILRIKKAHLERFVNRNTA